MNSYEVIYSLRKTVSLSVKDGRLIVRAPFGVDESKIRTIIAKHSRWVENALARSCALSNRVEPTEDEIKELKRKAKSYLVEKTRYYAEIMGLEYGRITITSAKTRFGSCSSKKNISYSYRLMLYPERAIDYVVIHELSHLVHMNHSRNFYNYLAKFMPDYKEARNLLKCGEKE